MTSDRVVVLHHAHDRGLLPADGLDLRAAGVEAAPRRRVHGRGDIALEDDALAGAARVGHGHGGEQGPGVGVQRPGVERFGRGQLHDLAQVHHPDAVADVADDRQVVRDEEVGEIELALQPDHQVQDLGAHRDVQGRDGLVADHEPGPQHERPGHTDALALAAGELVREAGHVLRQQAHQDERLLDPGAAFRPAQVLVVEQRLLDHPLHGQARVERSERVLEDDLHVAPQVAHPLRREGQDVLALEPDLARGGFDEAQDAEPGGGLAAARLAHEPQGFVFPEAEGDVVHGVHHGRAPAQESPPHRKVLDQVSHREQLRSGFTTPSDAWGRRCRPLEMLTTDRGCSAFESACALPAGVIQGLETTSMHGPPSSRPPGGRAGPPPARAPGPGRYRSPPGSGARSGSPAEGPLHWVRPL